MLSSPVTGMERMIWICGNARFRARVWSGEMRSKAAPMCKMSGAQSRATRSSSSGSPDKDSASLVAPSGRAAKIDRAKAEDNSRGKLPGPTSTPA